MEIHVFIAHMGLGGAERVCVNLANEWARNGHEVHIAVLNLEDDINTRNLDSSVRVHSFGVSRLRYSFLPFFRYIKKYRPKYMLVFGNDAATIVQKLKSLHLVDVGLIIRVLNNVNITLDKADGVSPIVENYLKKAQKNLLKANHLIAQCQAMKTQLLERGLADKEKTSVLLNPVDEKLIDSAVNKRDETLQKNAPEIVFIGRVDPQKNPIDLICAYAKVRERLNDVRLRIVGTGVLMEEVRKKADELGVSDGVIFDNIRTDMDNVYAGADVVALTSNYEGMPNCLIEAIGCGVPVVSYDCPMGPAEIVIDGRNGYLVPMGDVTAMADRLLDAIQRKWDVDDIRATCDRFRVKEIAAGYIELFDRVSKNGI